MSIPLTQLKMFADIQAQLDAVTPGDLAALKPGGPVPEGATGVGELSTPLKAMMCIGTKLATKGIRMADEALANHDADESVDLSDHYARMQEVADEVAFHRHLFLAAFRAEFPEFKGMSLGIGPNFEVYKLPAKQLSLADLLGGGGDVPVIRIRLR